MNVSAANVPNGGMSNCRWLTRVEGVTNIPVQSVI